MNTRGGRRIILFVPGQQPKPVPDAHRSQLWRCLLEGVRRLYLVRVVGSQYRSGIYAYDADQIQTAQRSLATYAERLADSGHGAVTTEVLEAPEFYFAEDYHQQYLAKNPGGYCGLGGTGVSCPVVG